MLRPANNKWHALGVAFALSWSVEAWAKLPSCVQAGDHPLSVFPTATLECLIGRLPCVASIDLCGPSALTLAEAIPFCSDLSGEEISAKCPPAGGELESCLAEQACDEGE